VRATVQVEQSGNHSGRNSKSGEQKIAVHVRLAERSGSSLSC
jgi:hypothetical protein